MRSHCRRVEAGPKVEKGCSSHSPQSPPPLSRAFLLSCGESRLLDRPVHDKGCLGDKDDEGRVFVASLAHSQTNFEQALFLRLLSLFLNFKQAHTW